MLHPVMNTVDTRNSRSAGRRRLAWASIALAGDGQFLYALNSIEGTISGFAIGEDGALTLVTSVGGLPANAFGPLSIGLAARDNG